MILPRITPNVLNLVVSRLQARPLDYMKHIYEKIEVEGNTNLFNDRERTNLYATGIHLGVYELLDLSLQEGMRLPIVTPNVRKRVLEQMFDKSKIEPVLVNALDENPEIEGFFNWLKLNEHGGLLDSLTIYELLRLQAKECILYG